jgi:hypothetical protein
LLVELNARLLTRAAPPAQLESADATAPQLLDALRVLSSLVISRADLEASMVGRAVNRLCKHSAHAEVSRVAGNLVSKWRLEVDRAKAVRDGGGRKRAASPQPRVPPPRPLAVLRDDGGASLNAELGSFAYAAVPLRRSYGAGVSAPAAPPPVTPAQREQWRAAFRACLEQGGTSAARIAVRLQHASGCTAHALVLSALLGRMRRRRWRRRCMCKALRGSAAPLRRCARRWRPMRRCARRCFPAGWRPPTPQR